MARNLGFLVLILLLSVCDAAVFRPISDGHRSAALELFSPVDGSFGSLEETYEALRTFQILGIEKNVDVSPATCPLVVETLVSPSSMAKDLFYALRVNSILGCQIDAKVFEDVASKLQAAIKDASTLLDFYYSIGSLVLIKDQDSKINVLLEDADGIFHSIKALSQSDGRWRYNSNGAESSTYAAGVALEALSGVVSLAGSDVDQSMIGIVKNDIVKLFDTLESYDDGALYFDEKVVDASEHQGPLSTTSSVVHGITAFAAATSGSLNIPGDKILGLAYFFLGIGIPGNTKDLFNQMESLACLENNRVSIPLILSLPAKVLSLSSKDQLKVKVNTVLGSDAPPLTVKLVKAFPSSSRDSPTIQNQKLKFDVASSVHSFNLLSKGIDVGKYKLVFEVLLHDPEHKKIYATGGRAQASIFITEDYSKSFIEAVAVFHHARIYDAKTKMLKPMKPLPPKLLQSLDGDLDFLGPELPPSVAAAIAQGRVDPITMEAYDYFPTVQCRNDRVGTGTSDYLPRAKSQVTSMQQSCFTIFSANETREEDITVVEQKPTIDDRKYLNEAVALKKLIAPPKDCCKLEVTETERIEFPNNNPFNKRKRNDDSLDLNASEIEQVSVVIDVDEPDVQCMATAESLESFSHEASDHFPRAKTQVISMQQSCFPIFSSSKTRQESITGMGLKEMVDDGKCTNEGIALEKLITPPEHCHRSEVIEVERIEFPSNNPFKKRKRNDGNSGSNESAIKQVSVVTDLDEPDVQCVTPPDSQESVKSKPRRSAKLSTAKNEKKLKSMSKCKTSESGKMGILKFFTRF